MTLTDPTASDNSVRTTDPPFDDSGKPPLVRSPLYVLRLVIGLVLTSIGIGLLLVFENALLGLRIDVATVQESWPEWVADTVEVTLAVALLVTIIGTNVYLLAHRKFRRWLVVNLAAIVAIALVVLAGETVLAMASSPLLAQAIGDDGTPGTGLGNEGLASLMAVLTVSGPWITRRLRPWAGGVLAAAIALSFVGGTIALVTVPMDIGVGILAGAAVALLVGTPDRTPRSAEVAAALADSGIVSTRVRPAEVNAGGSAPWLVSTGDGTALFVKTVGTDQRAADLLFRLYRFLRLRHTGDRHPSVSLRRAAEHEALLSLAAAARGVRTPQLVSIAEIGADGMLLAYRRVPGRALESMAPAEVTGPLLAATWELVSQLHREGIAHRDLQPANVLVGDDGRPWLVDFGFAELAADAELLARDVAELLASTAAIVGTEDAVRAATDTLGPDRVAAALPWIQPLALSSATRARIGKSADHRRLRKAVADAVGIDEVRYERVERVTPRTLFILASVGLAAYALVPQLASASGFLNEVGRADLVWVGVTVVASLLTYVGAALGMAGAVPARIGLGPMTAAQLASSFSNRVTPAKVGGMATNVRFLQKRGIPATTALSAVGLNTLAGFAVHAAVLIGAVALAGTTTSLDLPLPTATTVAIVGGAVALVAVIAAAVPVGRRTLTRNLLPALRAAVSSIATIARTPTKLAALFAGSALVTASYTLAMLASLSAFGADIPVAGATAVYLAASAVGDAAPTPGGVGAIEAALIAGYTAVGVDPATAFAAVLLFRLVTFWLPILPGWLALVALQRRGDL